MNRINVYECEKCSHYNITRDIDEGVTPMIIQCEKCKGLAHSKFYRVGQWLSPSQEFYRPSEKEVREASAGMAAHARQGGLFLRTIIANETT